MPKNMQTLSLQQWAMLPLRLFLGITFIYAGIQKITDTQFFQTSAPGYIGRQIGRFALGSPIHDLLLSVAQPHAKLFGVAIILGEIAIGLGTLSGFLFRPAAFFGALLSGLFYLSASWHVYPYFYGADIVFTFAALTLILNGPLNTGLPSFDMLLSLRLLQAVPVRYQQRLALFLTILLGTARPAEASASTAPIEQPVTQKLSPRQQSQRTILAQKTATRRTFLWGSLVGAATMLGVFAVGYASRILGSGSDAATATVPASTTPATVATTSTTPVGGQIAQISAIAKNSAKPFTLPTTGTPGVLVHLPNGQFVAYDAACTHAGCTVDYDPASQLLQCPCHGAAFDPAKNAEVVNPPASTALAAVKIQVDSATGAIMLA